MNRDSTLATTALPLTRVDRGHKASHGPISANPGSVQDGLTSMGQPAHIESVSLPLTRLPHMHAQMSAVCSGAGGGTAGAFDIGDPGDCVDCTLAMIPTDCTPHDKPTDQLDYCQLSPSACIDYGTGGGGGGGGGQDCSRGCGSNNDGRHDWDHTQ